ncbi:MAG: dihydroorotase family protein [Gammaproteobacteria bacterium]|nr:dihydroorotase family protein [Gammaproteobacteria bacterium]
MRTLLTNCNLGEATSVNILIDDEFISYVGKDKPAADQELDLCGKIVIPGMIDPHVHVRDLELKFKEDWVSASKAALAGGVTTIIDMPNTKPATINQVALHLKRRVAEKSLVNYAFHFGATNNNLAEINAATNIAAIKIFMAESNASLFVGERGQIREIFALAKKLNKPVIVHAEMQDCINHYAKIYPHNILNHQNIRNRECAIKATQMLLEICAEIGNALYLAHITTAEEIALIHQAKKNRLKVFCEVTPHHLLLTANILEKVGNFGKTNPPLRTAADNLALLNGIIDGTVDTIGSDHAPHTLTEKAQDYENAPSGFPGLETTLPLLMQEVLKKNISLTKLIAITSKNAANIFGIKKRGEIKTGFYADITALDPNTSYCIDAKNFYSQAKYSPFNGFELKHKVVMTFINGKLAFKENDFFPSKGLAIEFLEK